MIVSHAHRFVFLRPMKVASSSVCAAITPHLKAGDIVSKESFRRKEVPDGLIAIPGNPHAAGAPLRRSITERIAGYTYFTICRHPWTQAVSLFAYQNRGRPLGDLEETRAEFDAWMRAGRLRPNETYFSVDHMPVADYYIRYEKLQQGLNQLSTALGLDKPISVAGIRLKSSAKENQLRDLDDLGAIFTDEACEMVRLQSGLQNRLMRYAYDKDPRKGPALVKLDRSAYRQSLVGEPATPALYKTEQRIAVS